ncbi:MAG: SUMF1/EgtB/PvdO family nonheme iron enzyme, partial [Cytophagales bacterium]
MKRILFAIILSSLLSYSCDEKDLITQSSDDSKLPESIILKNIEGGNFIMGGVTVQGDAPEVNVTLTGFQISEKEITNEQYIKFLNS